jgi:hypothetical protein
MKLGDESFELFDDEKEKIRLSFWKRAKVRKDHPSSIIRLLAYETRDN